MNKNRFAFKLTGLLLACLVTAGVHAGVVSGRGTPGLTNLGLTDANTMVINADGVGHVLLLPYFSAQNGNATLLSITNVDTLNGKIVKLRFRGAADADNLFDLSLFLAPGDVWTGLVTQDPATGLARLSSGDASCTLPALTSGAVYNFRTTRLNPALSTTELARHTREGYAEVITMADVPPTLSSDSMFQAMQPIASNGGVPRNCAAPALLATLTDAPTEAAAVAMGLATPTTGLQGSWSLINIAQTLTFSGEAVAVEARNLAGEPARGNYVLFPQTDTLVPNADAFSADPVLRSDPLASKTSAGATTAYVPASGGLPILRAAFSDFPDLSTPYMAGMSMPTQQSALLSRVLAVRSVSNEYTSDASVAAATDWLVSLPTRRYAVGLDTRRQPAVPVYSLATGPGGIEYFASDTLVQPGNCLASGQFVFFDRDGGVKPAARARQFCGATALLLFGASGTSALAASVATDTAEGASFTNGWARMDAPSKGLGWPLLGQAFIKASNLQATPGVSGNYGIGAAHSITR